MGFQVDRATHILLVLVKRGRQMGSQVALVKGNRQMESQVALVKGNRQMGFQVTELHIFFGFG